MTFDPVRIGNATSDSSNINNGDGDGAGQGRPNISSAPYSDLFYGLSGLELENLQNTSFENSEFASAFEHEDRSHPQKPETTHSGSTAAASRPSKLEETGSRDDFESVDDNSQFGPEDFEDTSKSSPAEKRKKKRFRLSHYQTRLLLNEYQQTAHPDAAHREHLAREIPGMSPRQVQVWFQNRRAKIRRLEHNGRDKAIHPGGHYGEPHGVPLTPRSDMSLPPYSHSPSTHPPLTSLPALSSIPQAHPQNSQQQYPSFPYSVAPSNSPPNVEFRQYQNPPPQSWDGPFYYQSI